MSGHDFANGGLRQALFEIGALFFITKMFFLGEDDEKTIKDLMTELDEARASPGYATLENFSISTRHYCLHFFFFHFAAPR